MKKKLALATIVFCLGAEFLVASGEIKETESGDFTGQNIELTPDGQNIISVDISSETEKDKLDRMGQLAIININNPKEVSYVPGTYGKGFLAPTPITVTPNGKNVIVADLKKSNVADLKKSNLIIIDISDPKNPKIVSEIKGGYWWQHMVVTSDSRYLMAVDSPTYNIILFDISDPKNPKYVSTIQGNYYRQDMTLSSDNNYLVTFDEDNNIVLIDVSDSKNPKIINIVKGYFDGPIVLTSKDKRILSVERKKKPELSKTEEEEEEYTWPLTILDISNPKKIKKTYVPGKFKAEDITITPNGKYAISVERSGKSRLAIIEIENPKNIRYLQGVYSSYLVTPGGKYIVATIANQNFTSQNIEIIDISNPKDPKKILTIDKGDFNSLTLSPNGKYIISINTKSRRGKIAIIDIKKALDKTNN